MRIDKFLKVSRLIKRRTVAKELADQGRVTINDVVAKAGSTVQVGDKLAIRFGQKTVVAEVLGLKETVKKEDASDLYRILSEAPTEQHE
jgi:ribosomal 50S subunit-recycling heat shock protein